MTKGPILVVDGDDRMQELLERWLGDPGYVVIAAGAMHAPPPADKPSLVIVNVATRRVAEPLIQSLLAIYAAPILIVSRRFRHGLAASAEAAPQLGATKGLPKPFTRKELLSAVHESLEAARRLSPCPPRGCHRQSSHWRSPPSRSEPPSSSSWASFRMSGAISASPSPPPACW